MDLHVRGGAGSERLLSVRRAPTTAKPAQPNRLLPLRLESQTAMPKAPSALPQPTAGSYKYAEGPLSLSGETETGPDGQPQVRGQVAFRQGRLELTGDGVFRMTQSARGNLLVGEGEFAWRDRIGGLLTGQGHMVMRTDRAGHVILQLAGLLQTRRRSFVLDGPGEAEVDLRASGAYVVRVKGRTTIGRDIASLEGDIELAYGEDDAGPLDAVTVWGRARTEADWLASSGEGGFVQKGGYGPANARMTLRGSGTYRHGPLTYHGPIVMSIRLQGKQEVAAGTIHGMGKFDDGTLAVEGVVEGRFVHGGTQDEFVGEVRGKVLAKPGSGQEAREGILTLTLGRHGNEGHLALAAPNNVADPEGGDGGTETP